MCGPQSDDQPWHADLRSYQIGHNQRGARGHFPGFMHQGDGKAKNARRTLDRVRKVMHVFRGEGVHRAAAVPSSRKLWRALREVDKYLRSQSTRLVNYAKRYRAGLRVGTSVTEGTANFLVNRRMNKQQQMRWSRRGADLLLQVRCAVYNGVLGPGLGNLFEPTLNTVHQLLLAA